ncbi:MAG TPA: endolytic transglycosylase MltG [Actinomycetota bacterium]|nr:endolytic transglycosylase MltG [Actinomycetota bacterium]
MSRGGRLLRFLVVVAVLGGAAALGGFYYLHSIGLWGASTPHGSATVRIPQGASGGDIAELLESSGVVSSALGFRLALNLEGGAEDIQAGRYKLARGLSARAALRALLEGPEQRYVTVTFPEGSWLEDFAARLGEVTDISGRRFMKVATSGSLRSELQPEGVDSLEGLLWPSTYQVVAKDDALSVAERMVKEFERRASAVDFSHVEKTGVNAYEAVIVASMVEAEAMLDSERPKIARVIYNRLQDGIPLGIDATVNYALGEHKRELTESDLAVDSPYNTRRVAGLPPTPIGAPGLASLEAAARPAEGEWLYYVLKNCRGAHAFSVDYNDFLEDKAAYQELSC